MNAFGPLPLSTFTPEERTRLIRSARKLERVLGTSAFLRESAGTLRPLQVAANPAVCHIRPGDQRSADDLNMPSVPSSVPIPRSRVVGLRSRRQGSIFDLSEEQVLALGLDSDEKTRFHGLSRLTTRDLPRPSLDSVASSSSSSAASDASSLFARPAAWSASSSRTSLNTDPDVDEDCPFIPAEPAPGRFPHIKRKRSRGASPLSLSVKISSATDSVGPRTGTLKAANSMPPTPITPTTPTEEEVSQRRHRKLSKITRTFGENVPLDLVFGLHQPKKPRRASVAGMLEVQNRVPQSTDGPTLLEPLSPPTSEHFAASLSGKSTRNRTLSAAQRPHVPFKEAAAEGRPIPITHFQELVGPISPPFPVYASGPRQPDAERWVGSWNRPDIHTVQQELRSLRWR